MSTVRNHEFVRIITSFGRKIAPIVTISRQHVTNVDVTRESNLILDDCGRMFCFFVKKLPATAVNKLSTDSPRSSVRNQWELAQPIVCAKMSA